ncbi:hypothetical protein [Streptomyces tendae]|uniref:hypothetical protein n=1 Tax=Streptomyces tendae TaxID=1932 RepID=UPI00384B2853
MRSRTGSPGAVGHPSTLSYHHRSRSDAEPPFSVGRRGDGTTGDAAATDGVEQTGIGRTA